jgi:ubiquinone/menaquinone biosynthesis C-methylase UbiE
MIRFSTFFSRQARKPAGLFGRLIMSNIFNIGNARLNGFVLELMSIQKEDHILEIGFGTGKLIFHMANLLDKGFVEGVDFSTTMVSMAQRRNKKHMAKGKVKLFSGNFDEMSFEHGDFTKACSVNTIYFWPEPERTARKIMNLLNPGGKFVLAFEDISQLESKPLDSEIFRLYSGDDVKNLLTNAGFSKGVTIHSRVFGTSVLNCAVATK